MTVVTQAEIGAGTQRQGWMLTLVAWARNAFTSSVLPHADSAVELAQRARHVRTAAGIGAVVGVLFALQNLLFVHLRMLGVIQLAAVIFLLVPAAVLSKTPRLVSLAEYLLLATGVVIFGALIITGGTQGTGLFWAYTILFLAFFMKGQRLGWFFNLGFIALVMGYFLWVMASLPFAHQYPPRVIGLFVSSLVFYTLIAGAFNRVRDRFEALLQQGKKQAEAAYQSKSRFLAAASHDLRQPAHALGLFSARLAQMPHDPQTRELVAGVDASVRVLQEMLDTFFDYSRLDAPSTQAHVRAFAAQRLFEQLHTSFAGVAANKGVRLRIRPTAVWLQSDPVLLHRVLLNLVSNALQHTTQGSVLVACRPRLGLTHVCIEVRDSGVGIAPEHHDKVFEEFYQVGNPERDRTKGLGLGLSIVQRSCQLLGHAIQLRSSPGRGTCFCVMVPITQAPVGACTAQADTKQAHELQGRRVMLIEDDEQGGMALQGLLQSWGCQVTLADSAQAACEQVRDGAAPDFVLSDYRLRGAHSGIDAVRMVREAAGVELPACLISGDTAEVVRQQVQSAGLVLLQKPVRPAKLRSVLRHAFLSRAEALPMA